MKLYQNKNWLFDRFHVKKMTIDEIAKEAGCSSVTIYAYLKKFDLA